MAVVMIKRFLKIQSGRWFIERSQGQPTLLTLKVLMQGMGILGLLLACNPAHAESQHGDLVVDALPTDAPTPASGSSVNEVQTAPIDPPLSVAPTSPEPLPSAFSGNSPASPGESYIDGTGYSLGATDRSHETASDSPGAKPPSPAIAPEPGRSRFAIQPQPPASVQIGPISVGSGGLTVVGLNSLENYRRLSLRPPALLGKGNLQLLFPLAIPAPITSLFGWRLHPVTGVQRFHTGTDLGAPMGTPVLAALAGRVLLADALGGYGLAIALEHHQGTQQTLYAHLSEIFVKPGEEVKQGTVIGRVGSTGLSTGPHLHFELRQLTPDGWVAMDAGTQLEYALAQLVKAFEVAKNNPNMRLDLVPAGEIGDLNAGAQG
ncbi:MAG TPA: peptidoglycan DD-metalloendopeptidase family protein [Coleofasciculaceae cyanobacterium]